MHPRIPLAFLAARAHCWLMGFFENDGRLPHAVPHLDGSAVLEA